MWFKVTVAPDGAIRSCEQVAGRMEDGDHVYYVEGNSAAEAIKASKLLHGRAHKAASTKRARQKRIAAGRCAKAHGCQNEPAPGALFCREHLDKQRTENRRTRQRKKAGLPIRPWLRDRTDTELAARLDRDRELTKRSKRRVILLEVRAAHLSKGAGFFAWLEEEIAKCGGGQSLPVAAE